jgi:hypothetical protein
MLPMLAAEVATMSAIVASVNPWAPNTSVAASRMRCWVASVRAQRRDGAAGGVDVIIKGWTRSLISF